MNPDGLLEWGRKEGLLCNVDSPIVRQWNAIPVHIVPGVRKVDFQPVLVECFSCAIDPHGCTVDGEYWKDIMEYYLKTMEEHE